MLYRQDNDQKAYTQRVQAIYEKDYTKWLGYGRKRGYREEAVMEAIQEMSLKALNLYERLSDFDELQLHA